MLARPPDDASGVRGGGADKASRRASRTTAECTLGGDALGGTAVRADRFAIDIPLRRAILCGAAMLVSPTPCVWADAATSAEEYDSGWAVASPATPAAADSFLRREKVRVDQILPRGDLERVVVPKKPTLPKTPTPGQAAKRPSASPDDAKEQLKWRPQSVANKPSMRQSILDAFDDVLAESAKKDPATRAAARRVRGARARSIPWFHRNRSGAGNHRGCTAGQITSTDGDRAARPRTG